MHDKYKENMRRLEEEKIHRQEMVKRYNRNLVLSYIIVVGIGFVLSGFVCSVGSLVGDLNYQCWMFFGLNAFIVFSLIFKFRLGILSSILLYVLTNNLVIYLTIWHDVNQVSELGLVLEFAASIFGFLFAYSLGVKHFFEDVAI